MEILQLVQKYTIYSSKKYVIWKKFISDSTPLRNLLLELKHIYTLKYIT